MFSEPVVGEKFFGREDVLELLNKRVLALRDGYRQNIALTGQSLAGKSSVILHFLNSVKDEGFVPVYVEVVKEPFRSFANKFIAAMLYNSLIRMGEICDVDMIRLLEKSQRLLPRTYTAIRQVNSYIERQELDEAYSHLLGLTSTLKSETGKPCVVILDEFDNLESLGVKNPFLSFGKVIMVQKDTMYIVSSSRNEAIKKIISEKLSLLFGNFEVVRLSNYDPMTAARFLDMTLAGFEIEEDLKKFLVAITDGNAFYLAALAASAKKFAIERMSSYIDVAMVSEAMLELVYNSGGAIHQYLMNYLLEVLDTRYKESYLSVLVAMANGLNKKQEISRSIRMKQGDVSKALARLAELGVVSRNGVFHMIDDAMLAFWLKHVYQRRRDLLVDGTLDRMSLFRGEIVSYISDFSKEGEKGTVRRLAELFNSFSNESVKIDSKSVRLPHFTKVETRGEDGSGALVICSFKGNLWALRACEDHVSENDIIDYIRGVKALNHKVSNRVIIPLKGLDENAKLLAKELKISIWDTSVVNMLFRLYGKKGIVIL